MISPEEIKLQALRWWKPVLQSFVTGEAFFPRTIDRIGKPKPGDLRLRFDLLQQEIQTLYHHSKNNTGTGYLIKTADHNFRRTGNHELPDTIIFETADDYFGCVGKKREWGLFKKNYGQIIDTVPELRHWVIKNCLWLTDAKLHWADVLKVCSYFINTPRPGMYLRQLPIAIHTKFIADNAALIQSLLNFLIPEHIRNTDQKRFEERYFLKYDEPLVRVRLLDKSQYYAGQLSDLSIPLSDFEKMDLPAVNVLITENKMNFLTLPALSSTIAVWSGGGFNVSYLRNSSWLLNKKIWYWGDIDEYGFQILHQLRTYYPHTVSIMMDRATFDQFIMFAGEGSRNRVAELNLLTPEEAELYQHLKLLTQNNRLEQEKLPQVYVDGILDRLITDFNKGLY